ncbi:Crp/Fnr family transcriptional regulator [Flavobacterium wongokense]|uniref:Crp/Fnr family transcriptional regulator n=1 Tax=Flavobacterium wongokense TaxID=2910674 RepID=UPI001F212710|nr:Crp/Fnr family transcriptional regulator [Flavobacterium sp. WG47]MCF6132777.1 Crp/Fnr family transcriptional regulator [Flavobacterium sp. WG47]
MGKELFTESIRRHVGITDEEIDSVWSLGIERRVKKGQYIIHNGTVAKKTCFISSGTAVGYFIDTKGEEYLIQFGFDGWWISDISSFLKGTPALLNVQAIEDTLVYEFSSEAISEAFEKAPSFQSYFLAITQNAFASFQARTLNNLSMSAEERYVDFCNKYPQVSQKLSQKWIASYLGISPESLSRLKSKLLKS